MSTLHISHNDLDGVGCGIIVKAALGAGVKTVYTSYDDLDYILDNDLSGYNSVIITDLSPSDNRISQLAGEKELMLIDHHISSEHLKVHPFVTHSIKECATLLTYRKFMELGYDVAAYENFALCVNDFDLWLLKRPDSLHLNMLLSLFGLERFEKRFLSEPYNGFKPEESMLIELEEERRASYIQNAAKNTARFTDRHGKSFCVVFAEMYTSELGNHIIKNTDLDYIIIIHAGRRKVSMRSRKGIDISGIAIHNGGGGHKNAAGFNIETDFNIKEILRQADIL